MLISFLTSPGMINTPAVINMVGGESSTRNIEAKPYQVHLIINVELTSGFTIRYEALRVP